MIDDGAVVDSCTEEASQLKLTEVFQAPLVKQNLDTNVIMSIFGFSQVNSSTPT